MVQALQFILWILAKPNLRGFPPKPVVPKKEKFKNQQKILIEIYGSSLAEV